tara:strand:- start:1120 stop:1410 length:291 start_codon:yes stop_codon:yes gene_type:complete
MKEWLKTGFTIIISSMIFGIILGAIWTTPFIYSGDFGIFVNLVLPILILLIFSALMVFIEKASSLKKKVISLILFIAASMISFFYTLLYLSFYFYK